MEAVHTSSDYPIRDNPMGKARKDDLRVGFDPRLNLEFHGTKVTSDAGLLAYRELDEALGLTTSMASEFCDNRTGKNTQHAIPALLRQSIYSRLAGYEDTNDAERLCIDPVPCGRLQAAESPNETLLPQDLRADLRQKP
jgi:hypothetical protein